MYDHLAGAARGKVTAGSTKSFFHVTGTDLSHGVFTTSMNAGRTRLAEATAWRVFEEHREAGQEASEQTLARDVHLADGRQPRLVAAYATLFSRPGGEESLEGAIRTMSPTRRRTPRGRSMNLASPALSRRERNKQAKLDRITAAASVLDAVMAVLQPIVECNRVQVENGRTYLREMVFGDPTEPQRRAALAIVGQTEAAITAILARDETTPPTTAATLAHVISAVMFLEMSASTNSTTATNELLSGIRRQVQAAIAR